MQYPAYLSAHRATLSAADLERFEKQQQIVGQIVAKFEEPGADKEPPLTDKEEEERQQRLDAVVDLVAKVRARSRSLSASWRRALRRASCADGEGLYRTQMNECGAPPSEIMGEMPPGASLSLPILSSPLSPSVADGLPLSSLAQGWSSGPMACPRCPSV